MFVNIIFSQRNERLSVLAYGDVVRRLVFNDLGTATDREVDFEPMGTQVPG